MVSGLDNARCAAQREQLSQLLRDDAFADLELVAVDGKRFRCHKAVLALVPFFRA
jgi:hypothetical protein